MTPRKTNRNHGVNGLVLGYIVLTWCGGLARAIKFENSAYHDIVVDIRENVPISVCNVLLQNLELTLKRTSEYLYTALDGRAYFGSVIVNLPNNWPNSCVPNNSSSPTASQGSRSDLTITTTNLLFGDKAWTQQYGVCGLPGDQMFVSYRALEGKEVGKDLLKEWAKYRYGIFDEVGFYNDKIYPQCYFTDTMHITGCSDGPIKDVGLCANPNPHIDMVKTVNKTARSSLMYVPQAAGVTMFCDEGTHDRYAPTKHNLLCERKSTLEVILRHADFVPSNLATVSSTTITNTNPVFSYRRRVLTRYILVIDETQEILLRESWNFLRNAIRKWVVHDLRPNTEVGIVLAGSTVTNKVLQITKLDMQKNRDLVASFIPYAPSETRQTTCLSCALRTSLEMLDSHRKREGNASHVILVIAPGMNFATDSYELASAAVAASARIVTINYPSTVRRQPLDKLAWYSGGTPFTIVEKKYNSEKTFLDTYFELAQALFYISQEYYEGPINHRTLEIHRKQLLDISSDYTKQSKRASRVIQGTFFLDGNMENPSGFFIYTHNAETPLIQNVRLTSPSGIIYNTRSDQRMPVKQLTLLANINETGAWSYMVERFNGNPQPHIVQVLATPQLDAVNVVRARAWIVPLQPAGPFIIYCEVKRGDYPIHSAYVKVTVTRPDVPCNYTNCESTYKLHDTGAGDPDITKGDGIYSRYLNINSGPGMYKIDIFVDDNGNTAHSLQDNASVQNIQCCGSSIPTKHTRQILPFQRYLPSMTIHLTREDIDSMAFVPLGRIGDLVVSYLDEGKVRLAWTTPDMGGEGVARYEIKFAFSIEDIIDRYDTAAIMWNHDTPYPNDIGDMYSFILDINLEPRLFGQAVFFAIRPYAKLANNAIAGPVSNAVRTYIPTKAHPTPPPQFGSTTSGYLPNENAADYDSHSTRNNTLDANDAHSKVMYSIPIILGTLCVLSVVGIFYLISRYRRRGHRKGQQSRQNSTKLDGNLSEIRNEKPNTSYNSNHSSPKDTPSASPTHPPANESSTMHATTTTIIHNYATLDTPDHRTLGIPMYNNQNDFQKPRLSTSGSFNGITHVSSHDYLVDDMNPTPMPGYYTTNCGLGGLSVISAHSENATLPRPTGSRTVLSPYESWTASQLLGEHEHRTSPLNGNDINQRQTNNLDADSLNGNPPPIPPLPYAPDIYNQYPYPYGFDSAPPNQHQDPMLTTYSSIVHPTPEQQQQQQQQQQPSLSYNYPGGCKSNLTSTGDKKRRNVTMV